MDGAARQARRHPVGAEPVAGGVHLRVWAPGHEGVALVTPEGPERPLRPEEGGHFSLLAPDLAPGSLYGFRLAGEDRWRPDPASRFQPEGPDGWSQVVDPAAFAWTDAGWPGVALPGQVLYEMHVGTFTEAGTWEAAARDLPRLKELGVTVLEVMPVAEWAGRWGWGYDGVAPFAPTRNYGTPDDMRAFVDRAHALGLGVILDVVYNHLGPDGNHIPAFAPQFLSEVHKTDWGQQPNFDREGSEGVRAFVLANVAHWIAEYHLDGFRLDATQNIKDESPTHILAEIARTAREAAGGKPVLVIAENEPQDTRLLHAPEEGGHGFDAVWADDLHHSAFVAVTGRAGGYQSDYAGSPQELISAFRRGYLFQGQRFGWQGKRRGTPGLDLQPMRFVAYLENHDQVANSGLGERIATRTSPGRLRAITALQLLGPATPLLFQGQETGGERPFTYFLDVGPHLHDSINQGRRKEMGQFENLAAPEMADRFPDAAAEATFRACKLRPPGSEAEAEREGRALALHRDLLRLRLEEPAFRRGAEGAVEGAVLGPEALVLRFFAEEGDRLLLVNLGRDLRLPSPGEPLLGPPTRAGWRVQWSSEHPDYGGLGTPPIEDEEGGWFLPGHAAVVMAPA